MTHLAIALFALAIGYALGRADLRDLGPFKRRWPRRKCKVYHLPSSALALHHYRKGKPNA